MPLAYQESGTTHAPSVVFLHGVATGGWMWRAQLDALSDYHCITVDLPGHGSSNDVPWVSLADTVEQVAAILRTTATQQRAHVVGLSLGGYVGLGLLAWHTDAVERAVLSGVTSRPMPNGWFMPVQARVMAFLLKRPGLMRQQAASLGVPDDSFDAYMDHLRLLSREAYIRIYEELVDFRLPPALGQVDAPVLAVAGSRETPIIVDAVADIQRALPHAQGYLATGLNHGWNLEAPALFNAMLRAWFTGQPMPNGLRSVRADE